MPPVAPPSPSSIRKRPPDQRVAARNQYAQPLLEQLKAFLDTSLNRVSGKSALAQAIRYARSRWQALTRYVTDGRLEMSNNAAERAMKPPVQPSGFGLPQAGREHRDGGVVGSGAGANMPADRFSQGSEQELRLADPIGQRGTVERDAFAGIDDGLAVQRRVVTILRHQHVSDQARTRPSAFDRQRRHRRLHRSSRTTGSSASAGRVGSL